jgi:hypothetical protein
LMSHKAEIEKENNKKHVFGFCGMNFTIKRILNE